MSVGNGTAAGPRPRVLMAITVYNGRSFVPACIESAARLRDGEGYDLDVVVLDDASPEPGFSEDLASWCEEAGVGCYRTPRNLGIVRNVNLGLLRCLEGGYDHVIICNSDVLFPSNLIDVFLAVLASDATIGSVTAWSNNVSMYSLPNADPDRYLGSQAVVDWVSASLEGEFGHGAIDVPAGISFCICIPRHVITDVGVMDPVFGRGYCEETDWSLRSAANGWRITVAPSAFVYHRGRGSTIDAGMVTGGHTTVPENEAVIDLRYPTFRSQVQAFAASDVLTTAFDHATRRLVHDGAQQFGYRLSLTWLAPDVTDDDVVMAAISPGGSRPRLTARFAGFEATYDVDLADPEGSIRRALGDRMLSVGIRDRGELADRLFATLDADKSGVGYRYPGVV